MKSYETSATVEDRGQVRVTGVPFAPGTRVEVTVSPIENGNAEASEPAGRAHRLLAALDKGRNIQPIGPLRRADLYDRGVLH